MSGKQHIEKLVEETLASLDGIRRAEPKPFFYTRLHSLIARVENNGWERLYTFLTRPAVAFGFVTLILLLNTLVFLAKIPPKGPASAVMAGQTESLGSEEYGIAANDYYYFEESQ